MAYNYTEIDIDEMNIEYNFSAQEINATDFMNMINLYLRGSISTYRLPLTGITAGKTLTIRNRDFGLTRTGRYCGVKFVLQKEEEAPRGKYYFFFKDQTAQFVFDGQGWLPTFAPIIPTVQMGFIKDTIEYGYLNLKDYADRDKKILFSNLDLSSFDPMSIDKSFFRHGDINQFSSLIKESFVKHTHIAKPHSHNSKISGTKKADVLNNITNDKIGRLRTVLDEMEDLSSRDKQGRIAWLMGNAWSSISQFAVRTMVVSNIKDNCDKDWIDWLTLGIYGDGSDDAVRETDELSMMPYHDKPVVAINNSVVISPSEGEETRPKNISGYYVVKAW